MAKKRREAKSTARMSVRSRSYTRLKNRLRFLGEDSDNVAQFLSLAQSARVKASRDLIKGSILEASQPPDERIPFAIAESESLLQGYATLDDEHRAEIGKLIDQIKGYLNDPTRKRPLNALMLASPGAGKSHFIERMAASMSAERVQAVTFNMATMRSADDMAPPIDELRNLKVNDRFPLLFLDEFDSDPSRYAALLPLLWDGELNIGNRDLKLGKAVIVLAGSNPDLPKAMDQSAEMRLESASADGSSANGKLVDLLSRINGGVIAIPDLDLRTKSRDRRVDKVCVAVSLVKARFQDLREVPRAFLRFIANTKFRYGVRSIAHLIDIINASAVKDGKLILNKLTLPFETEADLTQSSLQFHLVDKDQGFGIVNRWKEVSVDKSVVALTDNRFGWSRYLRLG